MYSLLDRQVSFRRLFVLHKKGAGFALLLGLLTYGVILGLYFIVGRFFDFSNLTATLESSIGVTKENFVSVSLYISFVNSLLAVSYTHLFLSKMSSMGWSAFPLK